MLLLTPKSVNNVLNTKVQCCGRHQVNPVGGLDAMRMGARSGWRQEVVVLNAMRMGTRSGWWQEVINTIKINHEKILDTT
jgi:hypothetical protein